MLVSLTKDLFAIEQSLIRLSWVSLTNIITYAYSLELFLLHNMFVATQKTLSNISTVANILVQTITIAALFLQNLLVQILKTLQVWLIMLGKTIHAPFITLGDYYNQAKPYLDFVGAHIRQSFITMSGGVNDINTVSSEFLKSNK
jgi:hypothetical protein